jgi:hypothetical protein
MIHGLRVGLGHDAFASAQDGHAHRTSEPEGDGFQRGARESIQLPSTGSRWPRQPRLRVVLAGCEQHVAADWILPTRVVAHGSFSASTMGSRTSMRACRPCAHGARVLGGCPFGLPFCSGHVPNRPGARRPQGAACVARPLCRRRGEPLCPCSPLAGRGATMLFEGSARHVWRHRAAAPLPCMASLDACRALLFGGKVAAHCRWPRAELSPRSAISASCSARSGIVPVGALRLIPVRSELHDASVGEGNGGPSA